MYAAAAGLEGGSLHDLRHGHAQALAAVRKRLGHSSMSATLRYAKQADAVRGVGMGRCAV